jgi:hypothetical protein
MSLREIDKMSLTILMDNYSDMLLPNSYSHVVAASRREYSKTVYQRSTQYNQDYKERSYKSKKICESYFSPCREQTHESSYYDNDQKKDKKEDLDTYCWKQYVIERDKRSCKEYSYNGGLG